MLHKLRSFLTILGIVFGVGSVVAMLSIGEGASKEALTQIQKLGSNNIIISSIKAARDESSSGHRIRMNVYGLTYRDFERMQSAFATIRESAPAKIIKKEARVEERVMEVRVVGTTASWFRLLPRELVAGRTINHIDYERHIPVVVLTETVARNLLAGKEMKEQSLRIGGTIFRIIGIIRNEGGAAGSIQLPDQNLDVYIPLSVAKEFFGDINRRMIAGSFEIEKVELHQILTQVERMEDVEKTATGVTAMLQRFHPEKVDYKVNVPLALLNQAKATKRTFTIVLGSIAGISLLVGGIGIMNIMLASVTERTREIGIRRAIGAKQHQIIQQFLIETVVLSSMGGIIGLGVGIFIPAVVTYFSGMPTEVTNWGIILPLIISVGIGIIFGLYPAIHAARVDPIVALRHE